jgi:peptidase E
MAESKQKRQIIAMGGGGFSMEPENTLLDSYIFRQCRTRRPKVCFVPTASGDSESYIQKFYDSFKHLPAKPSHLSLVKPPTADLRSFVLEKDCIYVGGGNTKNLMALWREWGLDRIFRQAWRQGVVLCGLSAGSICWFEQGLTDSIPGSYTPLPCLGFLPGSNCPHYDGEVERRPAFHRLIASGKLQDGLAADDGVALHFVGRKLYRIVSSRPSASAYQVSRVGRMVNESPLATDYLGGS